MTPETYQRLSELFAEASELNPSEQECFLEQCRERHPDLRDELARLFEHDHPGGLSAPDEAEPIGGAAGVHAILPFPEVPGYRIVDLLGEGGMGQVWRAVQESTQREVALKLIQGIRFRSGQARARFEREVELSARLEHPNIARVYDSGIAQGYAYYAMELIRGKPLDALVAEGNLSESEHVALMLQVCRAVQHAHQRGIIHRDLKPSNVLVTDDRRPILVDFGLAKSLTSDREAKLVTQQVILGTPAYMSPEQAAGQTSEIDTRSDVYSLGVMLYRILTGHFPHDMSGDAVSAIRRVATEEIIAPRTTVPTMDRGLAAILIKALSRRPGDRYSTAGELADDLQRHLAGEPVMAHAAGTLYLLRRLLHRHRKSVVAAGLFLALLVGGTAAFVAMVNRHARLAQALAIKAEAGRLAAVAAQQKAQQTAYIHQLEVAHSEIANYRFRRASELLDECPRALRRWEWHLLKNLAMPRDASYAKIGPFTDPVRCLAFAPDGKRIAIATGHSTGVATPNPVIAICDAQTGAVQAELHGHVDGVFALAFTPDGKQVLSGGRDQSLRCWNVETGELVETVIDPSRRVLFAIQFSPDGRRVAFAAYPQGLFLSEVPEAVSWASILAAAKHLYRISGEDDALAFSPDGMRLAWTTRIWQGDVGHLFLCDTETGEVVTHQERPEGAPAHCIDYHPNGTRLITADRRSTVTMYSSDLSEVLGTFTRNEGSVRRAFYFENGAKIIGMAPGGIARIWDERSREVQGVLCPKYNLKSMDMAISRDRRRVAIATGDPASVRLWDPTNDGANATYLALHPPKARDVAISPDGQFVATCGDDGTVRLHQWPQRSLRWSMSGELPYATAVAFSPDAKLLAIGWSIHPDVRPEPPYGQITIVDVRNGKPVRAPLDVPGWIWQVRFDATGEKLVVADGVTPARLPRQSGAAHILDWRTGAALCDVQLKEPRCRAAILISSGDILVTANESGLASWDVPSGRLLAEHHSKGGRNFVHLLEHENRLITGNGASVEIRDLTSFKVLQAFHQRRDMSPPGVVSIVGDVAIHPSGRTLVSGSWNGTMTVWDVESGQPVLTMPAHPTGIHRLAFSPDGGTLFSAGHDGKVRAWSADDSQRHIR